MPSFQITISPKRRAATRFIGQVRRQMKRALAERREADGTTQTAVANKLDVHRSVINRELNGKNDIGLGRVGEFAWALGMEPHLEFRPITIGDGQNIRPLDATPSPVKSDADPNKSIRELEPT